MAHEPDYRAKHREVRRLSAVAPLARQAVNTGGFQSLGLTRLRYNARPLGWASSFWAQWLLDHRLAARQHHQLSLNPFQLEDAEFGALFQAQSVQAYQNGFVPGWRGERFDVRFAEEPSVLFTLERAMFRVFGFYSRAVHLNVLTPEGMMWVSRRSPSKFVDPGKLDNLVAGGMGSDEVPLETLRREAWEEAGIPEGLLSSAKYCGTIETLRREAAGAIQHEGLEVYTLTVAADFMPQNQDGEVSEFMKLSPQSFQARLSEFTLDAALVAQCTEEVS